MRQEQKYLCINYLAGSWRYLSPAQMCSDGENSNKTIFFFFFKDFGLYPCCCAKLGLRWPKVFHGPVEMFIWGITSISVFWCPAWYAKWHNRRFELDLQSVWRKAAALFFVLFPSPLLCTAWSFRCFQAKSSFPFPHSLTPCTNLDES